MEAHNVFASLQGLTTLVSQQQKILSGLIDTYCRMSGMAGPLEQEQIDAIISKEPAEGNGSYVITHNQVRSCLDGLGMWMIKTVEELASDEEKLSCLLASIGNLFVVAANGIANIAIVRSGNKSQAAELPPVLPYELAASNMRDFVKTIQKHRTRLQRRFSDEEIDQLSREFSIFLRAYREEPLFQDALLHSYNQKSNFSESRAATHGRFPLVQKFCGGLASAFPNTATVESDFSVINWEKDNTRQHHTDFSLEGILHCKQYNNLKDLSALIKE
ncbi:predicted protein [Phaeodactylum tricornutum CCAP 1055/1]|uniref:ATE1 protein n=1 Tax=Phaeodactylum tricornutum (strain CCAP 1055/1) TaxID=556484 RepID=B7GEP8_PHATC|nr:predicted protein [Phaeodactylum tricornutum CCAP 1055/1]EEC42950.1 predicted protein [Phaeodactylum tricornutum CCAP 1055/1]|eukprot:XP_002185585.1 predicted protein [Phaeodactylum tricornutum CCAP 1055/1]